MTVLLATVSCSTCSVDLATIRYESDRVDDAFLTASMVVKEHRQRGGKHRCGTAVVVVDHTPVADTGAMSHDD